MHSGGRAARAARGDRRGRALPGRPSPAPAACGSEQRFFHWDLEFPEVFVDLRRPRLGRGRRLRRRDRQPAVRAAGAGGAAQAATWPRPTAPVYDGTADLYVYFYHRGCEMLRRGGRLAYIVSNKWLRAGYGEPLRRYLAEQVVVESIVDFGHAPIFPDADTFPCIAVLRKPDAEPARPPRRRCAPSRARSWAQSI